MWQPKYHKKRISYFLILMVSLLLLNKAQANTVKEVALIKNLSINNETIPINSTEKSSIYFDTKDAQHVIFSIDNRIIDSLSLKEFRILYPGKTDEFVSIEKQKELIFYQQPKFKLNIEAVDINGNLYKQQISIKASISKFNSQIAWIIYLILTTGLAAVIYLWSDYRISKERLLLEEEINIRTHELTEQKAKYEEVLTNYLPKEEFDKLKEKDKTYRFKMVTVLFSNTLGFTKIAEQEDAEQLIDDLDRFFFKFDEVVQHLHIEKIKTIGDAYMCAGGIPLKNRTNPIEVVLAAFEMQQYMEMLKNQYHSENKKIWDLRMGIHTGQVFSNSNTRKKRLEIWGDTVNIASRMEASGEIGKVNITGMTYELVKEYFLCHYRGKMPVKYKGDIDMYIIEGFRPALSIEGVGLKPNQTFQTRLALIRFDDLEEVVMNILEEKLPKNLYYHNLKHTIDVTVQVELIGRGEEINEEELLLLKTAALFHDTGFTRTYKNHEEAGVEIAKEILPDYDYTTEQIEKISEIIMATKLPPQPKTLLQKIICDADLDYLGRVDFIPVSGNLFRELKEHNIIADDINKWNQIQIDFIASHSYFTETAKNLRDVNKNKQLEAIRCIVEENS